MELSHAAWDLNRVAAYLTWLKMCGRVASDMRLGRVAEALKRSAAIGRNGINQDPPGKCTQDSLPDRRNIITCLFSVP
jgi:hypothetical protein